MADGEQRKPGPRSSTGWDGKLRVEKKAVLANPEALSDPEYSDEDAPPVEQIAADEDLLEDYPEDEEDIDLVHRAIVSIPALRLDRFKQVKRLCLRQNQISHVSLPEALGSTLEDLDLYDNLISHVRGLEPFTKLTSLDFSFNKIKHIKNIEHLTQLTDLYFVSNKISTIENLSTLAKLRNLELGANRIREIANLDALAPSLEELWLGKNKIARLQNLDGLKKLKILSIQANRLTSLDGLDGLDNLEELYVSHNALAELPDDDNDKDDNEKDKTGLAACCPRLRVLDISGNRVAKLSGLKRLARLEEFWASDNLLDDFANVEQQLAGKDSLETVYLEGNPLQRNNETTYRNKVRLALPQVKQIDATFVHAS